MSRQRYTDSDGDDKGQYHQMSHGEVVSNSAEKVSLIIWMAPKLKVLKSRNEAKFLKDESVSNFPTHSRLLFFFVRKDAINV